MMPLELRVDDAAIKSGAIRIDLAFPEAAAFHLEVDEADADAEEQAGQKVVDADRQRHDVVDLLGAGPAERGDVLLGDHGVVERVILVIELDDGAWQLRALLHAQTLRQRAGRDIAHDDFERDDLDLADQLLAHIEPADEMRRHADRVQILKHIFGDAVVEDALAVDDLMLLGVEGGRVVLEMLNQGTRLRALVQHFGLAFVNAAAAVHGYRPGLEKIHGMSRCSLVRAPTATHAGLA